MKKQTCFELTDLAFPIKLEQTGIDSFTVTYGLEVKKHLNYHAAAKALGFSILHALTCDGKILP